MKLFRFLSYNNAVPVTISLLLLGAGSAFAASNPEAVYTAEQQVLTVDNTYIAGINLDTYTPQVQITGVTEDDDAYYVSYNFTTIDLRDYVWRDYTRQEQMVVQKKDLNGGDLGIYVTERLNGVIQNERAYLAQVQDKERKAVTQQTVATTYGGLVGKFLDATTETLPGYEPVIVPPPPASQVAAVVESVEPEPAVEPAVEPDISPSPDTTAPTDNEPDPEPSAAASVSLQVLGDNPAHVAVGSTYHDLGVVVLDPSNAHLSVQVYLDGVETQTLVIDTSTSTAYTIEYKTDQGGVTIVARRIVLVGDAQDPGTTVPAMPDPVPTEPAEAVPPLPAATSTPEPSPTATTTPPAEPAPVENSAPAEPAAAATTTTE